MFVYVGSSNFSAAGWIIYDITMNIIASGQHEGRKVVEIPSSGAFIKFSSYAQTANPLSLKVYRYNSYHNALSNKIWYACGDSYTSGTAYNADLDYGPYKTEKCTYPYLIGTRTGMIVHNIATSGETMTVVSGDTNNFSNNHIDDIGNDADYITLWFGINDCYTYNVPIGSLNDNVKTTFYGAWNYSMNRIINEHPYAKIGIIVSNSTGTQYTAAIRAIAKKWGVPFLDLAGDVQVPLMRNCEDKDGIVVSTIRDLRNTAFSISNVNGHPNDAAHEYQSTFIEHWLLSL